MKTLRNCHTYIAATLGLFVIAGCATIGSLRPGGGSTASIHNRSYDEVWRATITVLSRNLTIVETDKATGVIKAEKRAGATTWGEVVGVFITPADSSARRFTVEVVSMKRSQMQVTGQDWEPTIVEGIKAELGRWDHE